MWLLLLAVVVAMVVVEVAEKNTRNDIEPLGLNKC